MPNYPVLSVGSRVSFLDHESGSAIPLTGCVFEFRGLAPTTDEPIYGVYIDPDIRLPHHPEGGGYIVAHHEII